jgi:hypothetical protein
MFVKMAQCLHNASAEILRVLIRQVPAEEQTHGELGLVVSQQAEHLANLRGDFPPKVQLLFPLITSAELASNIQNIPLHPASHWREYADNGER